MKTESVPTSLPETPTPPLPENGVAPAATPPIAAEPIPEKWKPLFRELTTYYRNLPLLLIEGDAGRYVVIKGDELFCTWDTYRDASQYGHERFGDQMFMIHRVDPREIERLAKFFPAKESSCQG